MITQRQWILGASALAALSFTALVYLVNYTWTDPWTVMAWPQPLFFTFVFLGLGAGTVPVAAYLNHRFAKPGWLERDRARLARQGLWVGLLGVLLAYLQLVRALNGTIALVLLGVFILIETFFLTRE